MPSRTTSPIADGHVERVELAGHIIDSLLLPKVLDFIGDTLKKIPARIKTDRGFEVFTPEVVDRLLKRERDEAAHKERTRRK